MSAYVETAPKRWSTTVIGLGFGIVGYDQINSWSILSVWLMALALVFTFSPRVSFDRRLILIGLGLGSLTAYSSRSAIRPTHDLSHKDRVYGRIIDVHRRSEKMVMIVETFGPSAVRLKSRSMPFDAGLTFGSRIEMMGPFSRIQPALNPGDFDPVNWARRQKIVWTAHGAVRKLSDCRQCFSLESTIHNWGRSQIKRIENPVHRSLLSGFVLGDRYGVDEGIKDGFRQTGLAHLLAVSGLHVGGVAGAVYFVLLCLFRRFFFCFPHRVPALVALLAAWFLVLLAQVPLSALRAGIMVSLFFMGRCLGRKPQTIEAVSCACFLTLLDSPSVLFSPGFLYSFGTVYALITLCPQGTGPLTFVNTAWVASLASMPVEAYFFGSISPGAPLANLVLTPLASIVVIPLSVTGLFVAPWTIHLLELAGHLTEVFTLMVQEAQYMLPGTHIVGRWMAPVFIIVLGMTHSSRIIKGRVMRILALCALALLAANLRTHGRFVDFISVGQGDAILIYDNGRAALVDASFNARGDPLVGYLKRLGISELEWVLVTHHHPDHFQGLNQIIKEIDVKQVRHHGYPSNSNAWRSLTKEIERRGIKLSVQTPGDETLDTVHLRFFEPLDSFWCSENDRSLAVRIDGTRQSILLTGDLEKVGEAHLIGQKPGRIDVLQAGHHGSRTSTNATLLETVDPKGVVASLGLHNKHGFPHREVIDRLKFRDIDFYRTDTDGLIRVNLDKEREIRTHRND